MKAKQATGLAGFVRKPQAESPAGDSAIQASGDMPSAGRRRRGEGTMVALTVRLARDDWKRLHGVALSEGVSLQELAERGLSRVLQDLGLPPLSQLPMSK